MSALTWEIEGGLLARGYSTICGVDEAGRGPLAGPVIAAAVVLPYEAYIPGLDDSKKLTPAIRECLFDEITRIATAYALGEASPGEIDEFNILNATYLAMNRAIELLPVHISMAVIDGNQNRGINHPSICIVKGDGKSPSVAAASVLAKVTRDRYMIELSGMYPVYAFEKHKGYGTKLHYERLRQHGPCPIHRKTFLKKNKPGV